MLCAAATMICPCPSSVLVPYGNSKRGVLMDNSSGNVVLPMLMSSSLQVYLGTSLLVLEKGFLYKLYNFRPVKPAIFTTVGRSGIPHVLISEFIKKDLPFYQTRTIAARIACFGAESGLNVAQVAGLKDAGGDVHTTSPGRLLCFLCSPFYGGACRWAMLG